MRGAQRDRRVGGHRRSVALDDLPTVSIGDPRAGMILAGYARTVMDRPRQAVVLIHGIGEQRPMATLHSFVNWLLGDCADESHGTHRRRDAYYSKPDEIGDSFELRRIKLKRLTREVDPQHEGLNEDWPPTDFYEYYWAHRMQGTTVSHVLRWMRRLVVSVWRDRADVPELRWVFRPGCRGPMTLVLLFALLVVAGLVVAGPVLKAWFASLGVAFVLVALSQVWRAIANGVLLDVVGDAARYLDVHPANVACRYEILRGGVQMLRKLHDMRDESGDSARCRYGRIVLIGHSLGSVIAYEIAKHYWSEVNGHLPIDVMTDGRLDAAAHSAPDGKSSSGNANDFRRCQALAWQSINHVRWHEKLQQRHEPPPKRWLVSDLITLGSPLAYARFLLAGGRSDFENKVRLRELPTCPPDRSTTVHPGYYTVPLSAETEPIGEGYQILHHAAHFALTRWTNIHLANDPVGYRLDYLGRGIGEISAGDVGGPSMFRAHTSYWRPDTRMTQWSRTIHRAMLAILKERDVYASETTQPAAPAGHGQLNRSDLMTFKVTHANTRVYVNQSGGNRVATFAVSGAARLELKAGGGGHVLHYTLNAPGGVVSLQVPAQHWVEVDTAAPVDVQVDVHDGA